MGSGRNPGFIRGLRGEEEKEALSGEVITYKLPTEIVWVERQVIGLGVDTVSIRSGEIGLSRNLAQTLRQGGWVRVRVGFAPKERILVLERTESQDGFKIGKNGIVNASLMRHISTRFGLSPGRYPCKHVADRLYIDCREAVGKNTAKERPA